MTHRFLHRRDRLRAATPFAAVLLAQTALPGAGGAHHPGTNLDEAMGSRERYFQAVDRPAPPFVLADADASPVSLADLSDKVVVLAFIFAKCADVCPLHTALIADVQAKVNASPMRDAVRFVTVTTDPVADTADVLKGYGVAHGLDPSNWMFLTRRAADPEDATRRLAAAYGLNFTPQGDGRQMHGIVTHVIDRGGRFAAKFHGLRFAPVNLVLYLNGLVNAPPGGYGTAKTDWWERLKGLLP